MRPLLMPALAIGAAVATAAEGGDAHASAMPRAAQTAFRPQPTLPPAERAPAPAPEVVEAPPVAVLPEAVAVQPEPPEAYEPTVVVASPPEEPPATPVQPEPQVAVAQPAPAQVTVVAPSEAPRVAAVEQEPARVVVVPPEQPRVTVVQPEPARVIVTPQQAPAPVTVVRPEPVAAATRQETVPAGQAVQAAPAAPTPPPVQVAAATTDTAGAAPDQATLRRIVGKPLYGTDGVKIGTVGDVVVGREGRVVAALVSVGGFFGFGGRDVTVPLDRIRVGEGDRLTTTLPRDALDPPR